MPTVRRPARSLLLLGLSSALFSACGSTQDTGAITRLSDSGLELEALDQGGAVELWAVVDSKVPAPPKGFEFDGPRGLRPLGPDLLHCGDEPRAGAHHLRLRGPAALDRLLADPRVVDLRPLDGDEPPCEDPDLHGIPGLRPEGLSESPSGTAFTLNSGAEYSTSGTLKAAVAAVDDVGVTQMCFSTTDTSCASWVSYASTRSVSTTSSGPTTLYAWFRDADGNVSAPLSDEIFIDKIKPAAGTLTVTGSTGQLDLSWTGFSDSGSGLASYVLVKGSSTIKAPTNCTAAAGTIVYSGTDTSTTLTGLVDGTTYQFRLCAVDNAGNSSTGVTANGRPAPEYDDPTTGSVVINDGATYTRSGRVTLTLSAEDPSGVGWFCANANGATCTRWTTYATTATTTIPTTTGVQRVYVWFKDTYGNVTDTAVTDTIIMDTTKPTNGVVTANPSAGQVILSWSGFRDPAGSGVASYKVVGRLSATAPGSCSGTALYEGTATTTTLTGLTDGGTYSFRVCAVDTAGNTSTGSTVSARPAPEYDAPTGTLALASGATYTGAARTPFTIDATDASGLYKYCATTASKCTPNTAYTGTGTILLPRTTGTKKVNLFLSDIYNNVSTAAISDTIIMDATKPTGGAATAEVVSGSEIGLTWSGFADAHSGLATYKVVYALGNSAPSSCSTGRVGYTGADLEGTVSGLLPNKKYSMRVCAVDAVGNIATGVTASATTAIEAEAPDNLFFEINDGALTTDSPDLSLALSAEDESGVTEMCVSEDEASCTDWVDYDTVASYTLPEADGNYTLYATFKDSLGNRNEPLAATIALDTTAPEDGTVSLSQDSDTSVVVTWADFTDATAGIDSYRLVYRTDGAEPADCEDGTIGYSGSDETVTLSGLDLLSDLSVRVCAFDLAGLSSAGATASLSLVDVEAPYDGLIAINGGDDYTGDPAVTLSLSAEDSVGVAEVCVSNDAAACADWAAYEPSLAWTLSGDDGENSVYAWFRDAAGNETSAAVGDDIILDLSIPEDGEVSGVGSDAMVSLSWSGFSDVNTSVESYIVVYDEGAVAPASCAEGTQGYAGADLGAEVTGLTNGSTYTFRVCAVDAVGLVSEGVASESIRVAPEYNAPEEGLIEIEGGLEWSTSADVAYTLDATDETAVSEVCVSEDPEACTDWVAYSTSGDWSFDAVEGTRTLYAWFADPYGNISTDPAIDDIGVDTSLPEDGAVVASQASDTSISLSWSGFTDEVSGIDSYRVVYRADGTEPADCADGTIAFSGAGASTTLTGLTTTATYAFRVCAYDVAGNESVGATELLTLEDTTAPAAPSISINAGASYTGDGAVTLALSATDAVGVTEVCLSNTAGSCTSYQAMDSSVDWDLAGADGTNTVYARFRDEAGNVSAVVSDSITLDLTAPLNGSLSASGAGGDVLLSWSGFSDARTSIDHYVVVYDDGATAPATCADGTVAFEGSATSATVSGLTYGSSYTFRVCAVDLVGLVSTGATDAAVRVAPEYNPPEETTIELNSGATWTNSRDLDLALSATDDTEMGEMCFSESSSTCADWMPYELASSFTLSAGDGSRTVYAWFSDIYGNETVSPVSDAIGLDQTLPTNGTLTASQSSDTTISLSWSGFTDGGSGLASYVVTYREDGNTPADCADGVATPISGATTASLPGLGTNNTYGVRVCAVDNAGNTSAGATVEYTLQDTSAPTNVVALINDDDAATNSTAVSVAVTGDDATAIAEVCISSSSSACTAWVTQDSAVPFTLAATEGSQTLYVWARDPAGNTTVLSSSDDILYDVTVPVDGVATASPASTEVTLSLSGYTDALSGVVAYRIVYNAGFTAPTDCNDGTLGYEGDNTEPTVTGLTDGTSYTFRACAVDAAGNMSAGATVVSRPGPEFDAPTDGVIVINGGASATNSPTLSIASSATDVSGIKKVCFSESASTCTSWITWGATKSYTMDSTPGSHTIYAWFEDYWSNQSASAVSATILLDTGVPTNGTITSITATGDHTATAVVTGFSDGSSGVAGYVAVSSVLSAPASCTTGTQVYNGSATPLSLTGLTGGKTNYIRICAKDAAGNLSTGVTTSVLTGDTEAPTSPTVSINAGAIATKSTTVTLTLSAADDGGVTQMCVSTTTTCTAWATYATSKSQSLGTGTGTKTVYVKFRDAKLNTSAQVSDTIIVDTVVPVNGTLSATATAGQNALTWTGFSDALSGIASYKVVYSTTATPASCSAGTALYAGSGTSTTHTGLTKGKTYYYRACAVDNATNMSTGATKSVKAL